MSAAVAHDEIYMITLSFYITRNTLYINFVVDDGSEHFPLQKTEKVPFSIIFYYILKLWHKVQVIILFKKQN